MSPKIFKSKFVNTLDTGFLELDKIKHCQNKTDLSLLTINIRSLSAHFDELLAYLNFFDKLPSCIVVQETWLNSNNVSLYSIPGYDMHYNVRDCNVAGVAKSTGGGISVYTKSSLNSKQIVNATMQNEHLETLGVSFFHNKIKYNVLGIYRRPSGNLTEFKNMLNNNLFKNMPNGKNIIAGDFNIDLLKAHNNNNAAQVINSMVSHGYSLCINKPTRPNTTNPAQATLIDHIWYNDSLNYCKSWIIKYLISDHFGLLFHFGLNCINNITKKKIKYRSLNDNNLEKYRIELLKIDWQNELNNLDVNQSCSFFLNKLYEIYDKCFPILSKIITERPNTAPWLTSELKIAIKRKNIIYDLYKNNSVSYDFYKGYNNKIKNLICTSKNKYYENIIAQSDAKNRWKNINKLINKPRNSQTNISEIVTDKKVITDQNEICDALNNHFSNIGQNMANSIPQRNDLNYKNYLGNEHSKYFKFFPITEIEVVKAINQCKKTKKSPLLEVPSYIYKKITDLIKFPITIIFNKSIESGCFPDKLKVAKVIALFKGGEQNKLSNYRPISLLPWLSKVFERIIHKRMCNFLKKYKLLNESQFGFRKGKSTSDALHNIINSIYNSLNKKESIISVYLDFAKAFDCVDHDILINKLQVYGFRGTELNWFRSYLSNRMQFVHYNGHISTHEKVIKGVPQGSVLGPLLFIIFINDIFRISDTPCITCFADDSTLVISNKNILQLEISTNIILSKLYRWLCANKLKLNINKTKYTIFSNKKILINPIIKINEQIIERTACTKLLGIDIDQSLNFSKHISKVCSKIAYCSHILTKLKGKTNIKILKSIYYAFANPIMEYAISIWGSTAKCFLQPLHVVQNSLIRAMQYVPRYTNMNIVYKNLKILRISSLYYFSVCNYMFKAVNNSCPEIIKNILIIKNTNKYVTRQSNYLRKPQYTLSKCTKSLSWKAPTFYNLLPQDIKDSSSNKVFKNKLKVHILSQI